MYTGNPIILFTVEVPPVRLTLHCLVGSSGLGPLFVEAHCGKIPGAEALVGAQHSREPIPASQRTVHPWKWGLVSCDLARHSGVTLGP